MKTSDQSLPPSRRRSLSIAQRILTAIQDGTYGAGERLPPEREVAERFDVSRPTAREAILALELAGAVTVRHGDGTYISEFHGRFFDSESLDLGSSPRDVLDARITVEPPVSGMLTAQIVAADLAPIREDLDTAAKLIDDVSALPSFVDFSLRFHANLAQLCENRILKHLVSELVDIDRQPLWALINQLVLTERQRRVTVIEEHTAILDTVEAGDVVVAERAMRQHLLANKQNIFVAETGAPHGDDLAVRVREQAEG